MVEAESKCGFIDYITLSASVLFAGQYATNLEDLKKQTFYNRIKKNDYTFNPCFYLKGLEVVRMPYIELFRQFKSDEGVLFVVDPPYLTTDIKTYRSEKYWKLKEYLNVLNVLHNQNYIFFTSNKSSLVELCEWFAENYQLQNPFSGATLVTHYNVINYLGKYIDMMLYKMKE